MALTGAFAPFVAFALLVPLTLLVPFVPLALLVPFTPFVRLAAGACADAPLSARLAIVFFAGGVADLAGVAGFVKVVAVAPFLCAPAAVFDDAFFAVALPSRADVRVDFAAPVAFV